MGPRIAKGVRRVESVFGPDWRHLVDKRRLKIGSTDNCITAQVSGSDYETGCFVLGLDPFSHEPAQHGFDVLNYYASDEEVRREFKALYRGWCVALKRGDIKEIERLVIAA